MPIAMSKDCSPSSRQSYDGTGLNVHVSQPLQFDHTIECQTLLLGQLKRMKASLQQIIHTCHKEQYWASIQLPFSGPFSGEIETTAGLDECVTESRKGLAAADCATALIHASIGRLHSEYLHVQSQPVTTGAAVGEGTWPDEKPGEHGDRKNPPPQRPDPKARVRKRVPTCTHDDAPVKKCKKQPADVVPCDTCTGHKDKDDDAPGEPEPPFATV